MSGRIAPFKERLRTALANPRLPVALSRGLGALHQRRSTVFEGLDFRNIQERLKPIKAGAVARLPELVEQFDREAEAVGTVVHHARDAAEARAIVGEICRSRGARLVVKSKSMVSEEIEVNEHLETSGIEVVETDLGEWIIQLAHERPSHLIVPAIHKTREEVAELFSQYTGREIPAELTDLVRVARETLREKFIRADVGLSGGNIAIAESGTVVIVTNEGNGRLVTTLPPVHIAILGVEKIVPTLDDANEILKVLSKNATGQKMTSYVSFITGPSRSSDIELTLAIGVHGPVEQHVILLDNGRWAAREDPELREALYCIKCGACANVCPSYQVVGGHAFGHIYTGPIGLVLTAVHHGLDAAGPPQSLCVGCNACETVCPVAIPIPRQILDVRQRYVESKGLPIAKRIAVESMATPTRMSVAAGLGRIAQRAAKQDGFVRRMPGGEGLTSWRSLPVLADSPLRERLSRIRPAAAGDRVPQPEGIGRAFPDVRAIGGSKPAGSTVAYFPGCITDRLYPEMGEAAVRVLEACGCRVVFPLGWSCCGLPASNAGDRRLAQDMARRTIAALEPVAADYFVSTSASCVVMVVQDYPHLLQNDKEWCGRALALARRVVDLTTFLDRVAQLPAASLADGPARRVTYHDACQSANCLGLRAEARRLIRAVMGLELVEMTESSVCCGFGGSFSFDYPEVSRRILERKLSNIQATGADTVVADNPGCLMQLRGGLDAARVPIHALHLAELLAERL